MDAALPSALTSLDRLPSPTPWGLPDHRIRGIAPLLQVLRARIGAALVSPVRTALFTGVVLIELIAVLWMVPGSGSALGVCSGAIAGLVGIFPLAGFG